MKSEQECCPPFDPKPWEERELELTDRLFMKARVRSFFHIPLNFGQVMKRAMTQIEAYAALSKEPVILSDEESLWGSNLYIQVEKEIPGAQMSRIKGHYLSKAFAGPYSRMGDFIRQMKEYLSSRSIELRKMFFYYPLCPKCAKKYGQNYIVILANGPQEDQSVENI